MSHTTISLADKAAPLRRTWRRRVCAIASALCVAVIAVYCGTQYFRPMFANEYGTHEFGVFPGWQRLYPPAHIDCAGNFVLLDYRLNLVLVVCLRDQSKGSDINEGFQKALPVLQSIWYSSCRGRVEIALDPGAPVITIARTRDQLILVLPDATVLRAPLRHFRAQPDSPPVEDCKHEILSSVEELVGVGEPEVIQLLGTARNAISSWKPLHP